MQQNDLQIAVGTHYEADILFHKVEGDLLVEKKYRPEVECIHWLNQHLAQYYDPKIAMPVAQHEFRALQLLSKYDISAKPVSLNQTSIIMHFVGVPFQINHALSRRRYLKQCSLILDLFKKLNFFHNDLLPSNLLIDKHNQLKVIDFTLSEFDQICIMESLPNSKWARAYQDQQILNQYCTKKRVNYCLSRLLDKFTKKT